MVLGAEGAENEFLSEQNLYDAMQGFPLKIKKFPNQRYRQYCRLLYVSGLLGGISLLGFGESKDWSKKLFQKIWLGEEKMQRK